MALPVCYELGFGLSFRRELTKKLIGWALVDRAATYLGEMRSTIGTIRLVIESHSQGDFLLLTIRPTSLSVRWLRAVAAVVYYRSAITFACNYTIYSSYFILRLH